MPKAKLLQSARSKVRFYFSHFFFQNLPALLPHGQQRADKKFASEGRSLLLWCLSLLCYQSVARASHFKHFLSALTHLQINTNNDARASFFFFFYLLLRCSQPSINKIRLNNRHFYLYVVKQASVFKINFTGQVVC